ncbi:MAG: hypothetical protein AB1432_10740 [Bacteroidota bacterium]
MEIIKISKQIEQSYIEYLERKSRPVEELLAELNNESFNKKSIDAEFKEN